MSLQEPELQIDTNDPGVCRADEEAASEEIEEEDGDDAGEFEPIPEDTDEEYMPTKEIRSLSPSTSAARKHKAPCKTDKLENGEAAEGESKKNSVQCPVCDKSFKSKYYLKVHNRCTSDVLFSLNLLLKEALALTHK